MSNLILVGSIFSFLFIGILESQRLLITTLVEALVCSLRAQVANLRHIHHHRYYHPFRNSAEQRDTSSRWDLVFDQRWPQWARWRSRPASSGTSRGMAIRSSSGAPKWATSSAASSGSKLHAWNTMSVAQCWYLLNNLGNSCKFQVNLFVSAN